MPVATIIVKDECNIKITGVDLYTRKKLVDKFKYKVPGAYFIPSVRLGRWDGTISFFQMGGSGYVNMLPEIIPILEADGYELDLQDIRPYSHNIKFAEPVKEDSYSHLKWPVGHPEQHKPIVLRDYQVEIINAFLQDKQCIQEVATGAGKTLITAILSHHCELYGRTIVIVPNKSLVTQTEEDYINLQLDVGVYYGDRKELDRKHTICTWQSLGIMMKKTTAKTATIDIQDFLQDVIGVVVDECLAGDTMIQTPTGLKPIKEFKSGDTIISMDEETGEFIEDTVVKLHTNLMKSDSEDMYEFELDDGSKLQITGNHKVMTDTGWIEAKDLTEDYNIITQEL